jgi:hypothetical protein
VAAAEILLQLVENGRTSVRSIPEIFWARLSIHILTIYSNINNSC